MTFGFFEIIDFKTHKLRYQTCYKYVFLQYGFNGTLFLKIRYANQKIFGENWFCTVSWKLHILENLFF